MTQTEKKGENRERANYVNSPSHASNFFVLDDKQTKLVREPLSCRDSQEKPVRQQKAHRQNGKRLRGCAPMPYRLARTFKTSSACLLVLAL